MDRRQKALLKRIASIFVPLLILLVLSVVGTAIYFAYRMVSPERRQVLNTPESYEQILQKPTWIERTWPGADGTKVSGWLFYHSHPAPVVVMSHGYGSNREEMLSTSYRLWDVGYNVLTYDLRGHGASSVERSSLGPKELRDLEATVAYARTLEDESGAKLSDGRVGLYGVDLGGFVSLSAAANDPEVRAVAVDSTYPTGADYRRYLAKSIIGDTGPDDSSIVEGSIFQGLVSLPLDIMGGGGNLLPVQQAVAKLGDRPLLVLVSKTSRLSPLARRTAAVASAAPNAEVVELDRTRADASLIKEDAQVYDDTVVNFFTRAPDFTPPPRTAR